MNSVQVVSHPATFVEPKPVLKTPQTYDIHFNGVTEDELVYLRASLSNYSFYRKQSEVDVGRYDTFRQGLDNVVTSLFDKMYQKYAGNNAKASSFIDRR